MNELVTVAPGGVSVNTAATGVKLERALQNGTHRTATERLPAIGTKIVDVVRLQIAQ